MAHTYMTLRARHCLSFLHILINFILMTLYGWYYCLNCSIRKLRLSEVNSLFQSNRGKKEKINNLDPSSITLGCSLSHCIILPFNMGVWGDFGDSYNSEATGKNSLWQLCSQGPAMVRFQLFSLGLFWDANTTFLTINLNLWLWSHLHWKSRAWVMNTI